VSSFRGRIPETVYSCRDRESMTYQRSVRLAAGPLWLLLQEGLAADPPTFRTAVPGWHAGDSGPGPGAQLREYASSATRRELLAKREDPFELGADVEGKLSAAVRVSLDRRPSRFLDLVVGRPDDEDVLVVEVVRRPGVVESARDDGAIVDERGWRAYLTVDEDEPAAAIVYCPECADRELAAAPRSPFGPVPLRCAGGQDLGAGCDPGANSAAPISLFIWTKPPYCLRPRLTTSLTLSPLGRTAPAAGFCHITRPLLKDSE
jgi:hypothetical protein